RDVKVAIPAGIFDCATAPCIGELESSFARKSKEFVVANIVGYQRLFHGGTDPEAHVGFDDLLVAIGHADLATQMTRDAVDAIEICGAVEGSYAMALSQDEAALDACYAALAKISDELKGDF